MDRHRFYHFPESAKPPRNGDSPVEWAQNLLHREQVYGAGESWGFDTTAEAATWAAYVAGQLEALSSPAPRKDVTP